MTYAFNRIVAKLNRAESKPRDFGTGVIIFHAEIHTIEAIGNHPDINLTTLAQILGVTKGAVSQMIRKLESKSLIELKRQADNEKEIIPVLTELGQEALHSHARFHKTFYGQIEDWMKTLSDNERDKIIEMFEMIEKFADEMA